MVPNVWTQRKAPPKRGQVYGFLRKKGYWSSATGQFRARGSVPSAGTLATGVLPQSNRSGATDRRPATTCSAPRLITLRSAPGTALAPALTTARRQCSVDRGSARVYSSVRQQAFAVIREAIRKGRDGGAREGCLHLSRARHRTRTARHMRCAKRMNILRTFRIKKNSKRHVGVGRTHRGNQSRPLCA